MQYGAAWWFLDQKNGIEEHLERCQYGALKSLCRHVSPIAAHSLLHDTNTSDILCNILGSEMESGLLPNDFDWIGKVVENICFGNAVRYFQI